MDENKIVNENQAWIGSIIGTIVIIAVIILGGLYFWGKRVEESKLKESLVNGSTEQTADSLEVKNIESVSSSDDISSIQADLSATNLDNLGAEANAQLQ